MKILLFILIPILIFAQSDWSDVTVNYPDSLDDSTSIFKAVPGEAMRSANFNKLLRSLRIMQEKMGVLGTDSLLSSTEIELKTGFVSDFGATANDGTCQADEIQAVIDRTDLAKVIIGKVITDTFQVKKPIKLKSDFTLEIRGTLMVMNSDSGLLGADVLEDSIWALLADASTLDTGMWIGITDDNTYQAYDTYRAWTGKIASISNDTIRFTVSNNVAHDTMEVSANGRWATTPNAILVENKDNILICGTGIVHGNRNNQMQLHPVYRATPNEQQRAGMCITVWGNSSNITIRDLTFKEGLMHNVGITGDGGDENTNIRVQNVKSINAHDKAYLIRLSSYVYFDNCMADSVTWEDGFMFYADNKYCFLNQCYALKAERYGVGWNSNEYLTMNNVYTSDNTYGVAIRSGKANINNLFMNDGLLITNTYTTENVNITNLQIHDYAAGSVGVVRMLGNFKNVTFNGLVLDGCSGDAFYINEDYGGTPVDSCENVKFFGGGVYNHTGDTFDITGGADTTFVYFEK